MINALSLFANVGIAEVYLKEIGINVVIANEIDSQRAKFYKHIYPDVNVIVGDIKSKTIKNKIIYESKLNSVDLIMATPPCQGMSTAGKQDRNDERNYLICHAVDIIKKVKPKYVFFENVPEQLNTKILVKSISTLIPDYLKNELGNLYNFNKDHLVRAEDYGVPQIRQRAIFLLVRKDINFKWGFPNKEEKVTLNDAIGSFPSLDPEVYDISYSDLLNLFPDYERKREAGLAFSKWHYPPKHIYRQVYSMMHTPTGKTAFDNPDEFKPKKENGCLVKGFKNTYKRQEWNKPGYTITMYNRTISSQNNVHPGRLIGKDKNGYNTYSDSRVLTIKELMTITSLPDNWCIPDWASDHFIRQVIGEGIPPLMVKKIMKGLIDYDKKI